MKRTVVQVMQLGESLHNQHPNIDEVRRSYRYVLQWSSHTFNCVLCVCTTPMIGNSVNRRIRTHEIALIDLFACSIIVNREFRVQSAIKTATSEHDRTRTQPCARSTYLAEHHHRHHNHRVYYLAYTVVYKHNVRANYYETSSTINIMRIYAAHKSVSRL